MRLPEIELDDRRFQDLVSEARLRINRSCPEWTEHNVSDPGITLIELFAWMTEMTIYRLNRVPDKLHVDAARAARHPARRPERRAPPTLRFRLAEPPTEPVTHPGGETEVGTPRTGDEESIVFQVDEDFTIPAAAPGGLRAPARRPDQGRRRGRRRGAPAGRRPAAVRQPAGGRRRALPRLRRAARAPAAPGRRRRLARARRRRQPRGPAAALGGLPGRQRAGRRPIVLEDLTGGFNYGAGAVELQLPAALARCSRSAATACTGCAAASTTRRATAARPTTYTQAPEIYSITAAPIGALLPDVARRAGVRTRCSACPTARPGQTFPLRFSPVLKPHDRRDARGARPRVGRLGGVGAARRTSSTSTEFDRHYTLNPVGGEIELGPAIRETDGGWTAVRRDPAQGRRPALHALPPRRRAARQRRRRRAQRQLRTSLRRRRHGHQPGRRAAAASTPRRWSTRASARRWRSARATARSPPRTSSSSPARRPRASRARSASPPQTTGGPVALHLVPQLVPGRPPARLRRARRPTRRCCRRSPSTSTSAA